MTTHLKINIYLKFVVNKGYGLFHGLPCLSWSAQHQKAGDADSMIFEYTAAATHVFGRKSLVHALQNSLVSAFKPEADFPAPSPGWTLLSSKNGPWDTHACPRPEAIYLVFQGPKTISRNRRKEDGPDPFQMFSVSAYRNLTWTKRNDLSLHPA